MSALDTVVVPRPPARSMEQVLENRWARILIPSLSDLFFLAILAWVFVSSGVGAGWQGLLADADLGWHIRTGEYILNHHAVPHHDLYSFSKPGAAWYAWEWLTDVTVGSLHRWAGLKAIVLSAAVVIALFATTLIRRMANRGVHLMVALAVALLGVGASSVHFLARPHILTMLLLSISVWMIEADREKQSRWIWWLVPLTAVWTNLHGGFLALIAVLGLTAAGTLIEVWMKTGRTIADAIRYILLTAGCVAASLINPYGWRLHQHVTEYLRSDWIRSVVQEFQSPSFRAENMLQFEVLMLLGLVAVGGLFRRRRIVEGLWILYWSHMALGSIRHVPVFVAVCAPLLAAEIGTWWTLWTAKVKKNSLPGILNEIAADCLPGFRRSSILPVAAVVVLAFVGPALHWPQDFPDAVFPTAMVHAHSDLVLHSRVVTSDQWADYLIYTNPSQKVFVDGRSDFYGPEVGGEYLDLMNGHPNWQQIMQKYRFDLALLPSDFPLTQLLKLSPDWRVKDDDGKRILLVRSSVPLVQANIVSSEPKF